MANFRNILTEKHDGNFFNTTITNSVHILVSNVQS